MVTQAQVRPAGGWFAALPEPQRAALYARGVVHRYRPRSTLFHEGDPSDWVLLVVAGRIKVAALTSEGRDVMLALRGPGELVGELSAIDGLPRSATATAMDVVECRVIAAAEFREFLGSNPKTALHLLVSVCARLRDADRRRIEFVALDATGRVARRLTELADEFGVPSAGGGVRIDMPISQDDLAGWTGSSREAVAKALRTLRGRGWITTGRRAITVVDRERLRSRAT